MVNLFWNRNFQFIIFFVKKTKNSSAWNFDELFNPWFCSFPLASLGVNCIMRPEGAVEWIKRTQHLLIETSTKPFLSKTLHPRSLSGCMGILRVKRRSKTECDIRMDFDMNEYPKIFIWKFLTQTNIRIYSHQNFDTNEYPNRYSNQKYLNIRIY